MAATHLRWAVMLALAVVAAWMHGVNATPNIPAVYRIGSDAACDFPDISAATFGIPPGTDMELHVAQNVAITGTQVIASHDTYIYGGYATCASTTRSGMTTLDGSGFNGTLIAVSGSPSGGGNYSLVMDGLYFTNGDSTSTSFQGGALDVNGRWILVISNTTFNGNTTTHDGGAIRLLNPPGTPLGDELTVYLLPGTSVQSNSANRGGGISCRNGGYLSLADAVVSGNFATTYGGGIFSDGCEVRLYPNGTLRGVIANTAGSGTSGLGGGVAGVGGALIYVIGTPSGVAQVSLNQAAYGGGIYVGDSTSGGSTLNVFNAHLVGNTARLAGGAIYASYSDTTVMRDRAGAGCHDPERCSWIKSNRANGTNPDTSGGGAIFANGGHLTVAGTFVESNQANFGSAIRLRDVSGDGGIGGDFGLTLIGNVIGANLGAPQVLQMWDSSALIGFDTFSSNTASGGAATSRIIEVSRTSGVDGDYHIYGNIFDASGGTEYNVVGSGAFGSFADCNRWFDMGGFISAGTRSTSFLPNFENAAAQDFRLKSTSQLIDWCDSSDGLGFLSANGLTRPYDDPNWLALHGNYDLGALERQPDDRIFRDGFQ